MGVHPKKKAKHSYETPTTVIHRNGIPSAWIAKQGAASWDPLAKLYLTINPKTNIYIHLSDLSVSSPIQKVTETNFITTKTHRFLTPIPVKIYHGFLCHFWVGQNGGQTQRRLHRLKMGFILSIQSGRW